MVILFVVDLVKVFGDGEVRLVVLVVMVWCVGWNFMVLFMVVLGVLEKVGCLLLFVGWCCELVVDVDGMV